MFARTERLLLRPGWGEDAPALARALSDCAVIRNLAKVPAPYSLQHAEAFLAADRPIDEPSFLIMRRTDAAPALVGSIGIARRTDGEYELGYWIARESWGRGFATEAARAVVALARDSLNIGRLHAGHFLDNPASGRVLAKAGFRSTGEIAPLFSVGRAEAVPCRLFVAELSRRFANSREALSAEPALSQSAIAA